LVGLQARTARLIRGDRELEVPIDTVQVGDTDFCTVNGTTNRNELNLLHLDASVEHHSEHPLAAAIGQYAQSQEIELTTVQDFQAIVGSGVWGTVGNGL